MQIRKRLRINNLTLILSVVALACGLAASALFTQRAMQRVQDTYELSVLRHERLAFRDDFLRNRSDRARQQMEAKSRQIDELLQAMAGRSGEQQEKELIGQLVANQAASQTTLAALLDAQRRIAASHGRGAALAEAESRLASQFDMRLHEAAILSGRLQEYSQARWVSVVTSAGWSMLILLLFLCLATLVNSDTIYRVISRRIGRLREGAAQIGAGKLDHRIGIEGEDEFAALADTFDAMAARLQASHAALSESEEKYRTFLDRATDAFFVYGTDGKFIEVNRLACENLGYTRAELLALTIPDIVTGYDLARAQQLWEEITPGQVTTHESRHRRKDGSVFPVEVRISKLNIDGQQRIISLVRDITDRKAAELALRQSEERLRLAQGVAHIGTFDWDMRNNVNHWSPELEALYGLAPGGFGGTHEAWVACIHPDDRAPAEKAVLDAIAARQDVVANEWRAVMPDGSVRWIAGRARIDYGEDGNPVRLLGVNMDITERKQAEQAAQESEAWLRAAVGSIADEIWFTDAHGNVILTNGAVEKNLGIGDPEGFSGDIWQALAQLECYELDGTLRPHERAPLSRALRGEVLHHIGELVRNVATGELRYREVSSSPVRGGDGRIVGAVAVARDATERMKVEQKLRLAAKVYQDSSEAMLVTDENNAIIAINRAFTEITGYGQDEAIGQDPRILQSGQHDSHFYKGMWERLLSTGRYKGEIWNRRKNGELFAALLTINIVDDESGGPRRHVCLLTDITEKKRSEDVIWRHANFDALTGLPNRRLFRERLEHDLRNARRSNAPLALMFLDLDGFKYVNDTLGHDMGDLLLKVAAERLRGSVREGDTVARLGGDEFTVILTDMHDPGSVDRVARGILGALSEPVRLRDETVYVSASIGITYFPNDADDAEELIRNADQAMYCAKEEGKNCCCFFTREIQEAAMKRMRIINDLRSALQGNQFEIVYQPIVELATGVVQKAEALIRWQHPVHGLVNPVDFISAAEDTGMIASFGNWIFHEAARQAAAWRERFHPAFQISVNISPVQFRNEGIDSTAWLAHLKSLGLPGQGVVVEITEGLLLEASPKVTDQLLKLRDAGIEVALDDFGTGYSALSYLKKFDIDYIKIDQAFIRNMNASSSGMVLCEAMIAMAHKLGIKVIAEGVETDLQYELLADAGCDFAQGYLLSRPLPATEMEALLESDPFTYQEPLGI